MNYEKGKLRKELQYYPVENFTNRINEYLKDKENRNKKLDELIEYVISFKNELYDTITSKNKISIKGLSSTEEKDEIEEFKSTIYPQLENLINELLYINNPDLRKDKINSTYNWFHQNFSYFKDLMQMKERTRALPNEKLTELEENQNKKDFINDFHNEYIESIINNGLEHRTQLNNISNPSNLIKEFKRNHVNNSDIRKVIEFDNRKNVNYSSNDIKEIKNSYSYNRPKYNFNQLQVEKEIMESKNKEIREKRNLENIRNALHDFGLKRAFYKMNLSNRIEQMQIINEYKRKNEENKIENLFKNNNYKQLKNLRRTSSVILNNNIQNEFINKIINESNLPHLSVKRRSTMDNNFLNDNNFPNKKVITYNIKNLIENKLIDNGSEKLEKKFTFKVKIKLNKSKSTNLIFIKNKIKESINKKDIPSDALFKFKGDDNIIKTRTTYQSMCSFNQFDDSKNGYMQHFTPLSGFDMKNCHKFTINSIPKVNKDKKERTITPSIFAKRNFNSNDYLELRKTMNNFKINELQNLKNSLNKSTNQSISKIHMTKDDEISGKSFKNEEINMNKTLNHAFLNQVRDSFYPKLFLPKSGSGLLNIPESIQIGTKKTKKRKKK